MLHLGQTARRSAQRFELAPLLVPMSQEYKTVWVRGEWLQVHDQRLGLYMIACCLALLPLNGRLSTRVLIEDTAWMVEHESITKVLTW